MLKTSAYIFVATIFSLNFMVATPAGAADTARQGFVRCGGNNFLRLANNTEVHTASLTLRNFDATQPITIAAMRIYNARGVIIYDSAVSGLPAFTNGILGPANSTLSPHQTSSVFFDDFLPYLAQTDRPVQLFLVWTSVNPALFLQVGAQTVIRERDPVSGNHLAERARSGISCESILVP